MDAQAIAVPVNQSSAVMEYITATVVSTRRNNDVAPDGDGVIILAYRHRCVVFDGRGQAQLLGDKPLYFCPSLSGLPVFQVHLRPLFVHLDCLLETPEDTNRHRRHVHSPAASCRTDFMTIVKHAYRVTIKRLLILSTTAFFTKFPPHSMEIRTPIVSRRSRRELVLTGAVVAMTELAAEGNMSETNLKQRLLRVKADRLQYTLWRQSCHQIRCLPSRVVRPCVAIAESCGLSFSIMMHVILPAMQKENQNHPRFTSIRFDCNPTVGSEEVRC